MASYSVSYREREDSGLNKELNFDTVEAAAKAFVDLPARLHPTVMKTEKSMFGLRESVSSLATTVTVGKLEHYMPEKKALGTEAGDEFSSAYWKLLGEKMRQEGVFSKDEASFMATNPLKQGVGAFIEHKALEVGLADKAMGNSIHDQAIKEIVEALGGKGAFAESFSKKYGHAVEGVGLTYTSGLAKEMISNPLYGVELKSDSIHGRIEELKQMGMSTFQTLNSVSDLIAGSQYAGVGLVGAGSGGLITQVSAITSLTGGIGDLAVAADGGIDKQTLERDLKAIQGLIKEPVSFTELSQQNASAISVKGILQKMGDDWSFSPVDGIKIGKETVQVNINDFGKSGEVFDILLEGQKKGFGTMELSSSPMFYAESSGSKRELSMDMGKGKDA